MLRRRLLFFIFSLVIFGLLFISASSAVEASHTLGDKLYFIKKQLIWSGLGITVFFAAALFNIRRTPGFGLTLYIISLILLTLLFVPELADTALGARRWLNLGFIGVQPSEITKLAVIIYFSSLFTVDRYKNIRTLLQYLIPPVALIILEPNLSTAILISVTVISLYYLGGGEILSLFWLSLAGLVVGTLLIFISPYRRARLDPNSYHSRQMIMAVSSGQLFGKGFANSDQKYRYLPKISTDSILAVIAEETGFIGILVVIGLYLGLLSTIVAIGYQSQHPFQYLFCQGVALWIGFQALINMSAVASLIPLTGVPLPLISYGGSSLIILMAALGLVYSVNGPQQESHLHHRRSSHSRPGIHRSTSKR